MALLMPQRRKGFLCSNSKASNFEHMNKHVMLTARLEDSPQGRHKLRMQWQEGEQALARHTAVPACSSLRHTMTRLA